MPIPPATEMNQAEPPALDFDADTAVTRVDDHLFSSVLLDRWNIVSGPNGGYLAAIIARAMTDSVADPARGLRSLTVHFLARPDFDEVGIDVQILRRGRSLSSLRATMRQGDRMICSSLAAFSVPWTTTDQWRLPLSTHADTTRVDPPRDESARDAPPVAQNWTGHPIVDAPFFSGEGTPRVAQWIRAATPRPLDAIELVAISDAIPPAGFPKMTTPTAMPTVDLTVHIRASLPLAVEPDDDRVYAECTTGHVADGFAEEDCHMWAADGTLLAQSRQLAITL
jgi:acyl-CoA thioesterase